jgi:signal transduction histidine kinase
MEVINYAKDGREFWVEVAVTPIADGSNGDWYTHWVAVQRDVTERKRTEHKLQQLFEQATESSRLKSNFLATVSHEIRTPMNGVIGISRLLDETVLDEEQREYVGMIRQSADALMVIINDILDFSKIESGQLRIASQLFELSPVIGAVATLMDTQARSKDLIFRALKDPDVPRFMHSDPGRLRQVLINLVGNAIKFTPAGSVELVVSSPRDAAGLAQVRFEVRDSGIGIPAGAQTQLFQPFHQVDGSNARKYAGTGLGLAISRQLVERMGGRIGVESAPDVGSMFWFELPVAGNIDPSMKDA